MPKFDTTVSVGTIIGVVTIAGSVIGGSAVAVSKIDDIKTTMEKQGEKFELRLRAVEDAVNELRIDNASKDGIAKEVADHEARLRKLEGRG